MTFVLADIDVGTIVFLVVAFLTWIMNLANKNKEKKPAQRPARPKPQGDQVKSELEAFLEEVTGQKQPEKPRPQQQRRPGPAPAEVRQEKRQPVPQQKAKPTPRPQRPRRRPKQAKPRQKPAPAPKPVERQSLREREAAKDKIRAAEKAERKLGSGISEHVDAYIDDHVDSHLSHDINASVRAHLGSRQQVMANKKAQASEMNQQIVASLRNPAEIKRAIIVNEILAKPRALRRQ